MKNILLKFFIVVLFIAPVAKVFAVSAYEVPILVYHSIGPMHGKKESVMQAHYRVTTENFEKQMKYLLDNGYHPISFATYVKSFNNYVIKLPEKAVVLTFDDGWKSQYQYAVPILEKYKFTATFFIVTSYVDGHYGEYVSWSDLKDLVKNNFDIESHTKSHMMLTKLDPKKLDIELTESKKTLEKKLGIKVIGIAYPNYLQNQAVRDATKLAGYYGARAGWGKFKNSIDHIYEVISQEVVSNPNPFVDKRLPDLP